MKRRIDLMDLTNKKFNRLLVIKIDPSSRPQRIKWVCKCDCGVVKSILGAALRAGHTKSCGCIRKEPSSCIIHGKYKHRLYRTWLNMKSRCSNVKNNRYKYYGGKGIRVCKRWSKFINFFNDMISGYSDHLTLDRIKNYRNYSKSNCRWATPREQAINRCSTVFITVGKTRLCASQWADKNGVSKATIRSRINRGISPKQAVLAKIKK